MINSPLDIRLGVGNFFNCYVTKQDTGELTSNWNISVMNRQSSNGPRTSLMGPGGGALWWINGYVQSPFTVPLNLPK